jgi:hypothetical protein
MESFSERGLNRLAGNRERPLIGMIDRRQCRRASHRAFREPAFGVVGTPIGAVSHRHGPRLVRDRGRRTRHCEWHQQHCRENHQLGDQTGHGLSLKDRTSCDNVVAQ